MKTERSLASEDTETPPSSAQTGGRSNTAGLAMTGQEVFMRGGTTNIKIPHWSLQTFMALIKSKAPAKVISKSGVSN